MSYYNDGLYTKKKNDELYHFGIKGMKWGVRRYQNEDGSLTPAGKARYDDGVSSGGNTRTAKTTSTTSSKTTTSETNQDDTKRKVKTALKVGAAVAGTALAAYGAYKASSVIKDKAATKSYEDGKKIASTYSRKAADYYINSGGLNTMQMDSNTQHYLSAARATRANADERTKKVSKSVVTAAKYLMHPERYNVDGELHR